MSLLQIEMLLIQFILREQAETMKSGLFATICNEEFTGENEMNYR